MTYKPVKFSRTKDKEFFNILRSRVKAYFKENEISSYGNARMIWKTIAMILIYMVPYVLILTDVFAGQTWVLMGLWFMMGIGMAGIGMGVMHDANHGSYSKNKKVNKYVGWIIFLVGGSDINWQIQHNVLHHSFTNIDGLDEDIAPAKVLRFSPHQKRYKIHRLQHVYAWFFYSLMTIFWATAKDFKQLISFRKKGLTKSQKKSFTRLMVELSISKLFYYAYIIVLPLLLTSISWWMLLIYFMVMHFTAGFILASIFQTAHVVPDTEFPLPDEKGSMENNWAIHQLLTTANFSPKSKIMSWFVGGLNFQIEHHLFPNICHVHYKKISKIVKETAQEFNLPYYSKPTFVEAFISHARMLRDLGKYDLAYNHK